MQECKGEADRQHKTAAEGVIWFGETPPPCPTHLTVLPSAVRAVHSCNPCTCHTTGVCVINKYNKQVQGGSLISSAKQRQR